MPFYRFPTQSGRVVTATGAELTYTNHVLELPEKSKHIEFMEELLESGVCMPADEAAPEVTAKRVSPAANVGMAASNMAGPQGVKVSTSLASAPTPAATVSIKK
jgi:hypothetical protein